MIRVLFVCLGNICRSPMAEAIFNQKVSDAGLNLKIETDSCGTGAYHLGADPDPRTVATLIENNIPVDHKARQLEAKDFYHFNYIIAMDYSNMADISHIKPPDSDANIYLLRDFDSSPGEREVPDPYFGEQDGFGHVFAILDRSTDALLKYIREDISNKS